MRCLQLEYLRPNQIIKEREKHPIIYFPLGPLEWHGPAMPFGTDPLTARALAIEAAKKTGGVVMPTLFCGTERERPAEMLGYKGFEHPEDMYVWGMDVPNNTEKSYYEREDMFAVTVREYLRLMANHGYKLIVVINGHGAYGQIGTLERLAVEFSHETSSKVIIENPNITNNSEEIDFGHATLTETSIMMFLYEKLVDLKMFPPRNVKLKYTDWGIADDFVFSGKRSPGNVVVNDPRDATFEQGKKYFGYALENVLKDVYKACEELKINVNHRP